MASIKANKSFNKIYRTMVTNMPGKFVSRAQPRHLRNAEKINIIPYAGINSILFSSKVWSKDGKRRYNVYLQFMDVKYSNEPVDSNWSYVLYKGTKYYFEKPSLFKNPCRIRCNCKDFVHRFAWEDRDAGCLYGGIPKSYTRKTPAPPEGRPYVNPSHTIGMCYHLYNFGKNLEQYVTLVR